MLNFLILKKEKYCVDTLPLDKDILEILVKTKVFRRKRYSRARFRWKGRKSWITAFLFIHQMN